MENKRISQLFAVNLIRVNQINITMKGFKELSIVKKWQEWKNIWKTSNPKEKLKILEMIGGSGYKVVGIRLLLDNKITLFSYFPAVWVGLYFVTVIYTFTYYIFQNQFVLSINTLTTLGITAPVT